MTEYVRVNVSSATSPAIYNVFGEREAEVQMLLPNNFVSNADRIREASMAVMKMILPLSAVPFNSVRLQPHPADAPPEVDVISTAQVGFVSGTFSINGEFHFRETVRDTRYYLVPESQYEMTNLVFRPKHAYEGEGIRLAAEEERYGEHEIQTLGEFITSLNMAITDNLVDNRVDRTYQPPVYSFEIETDNTVSLIFYPRYLPCPVPYTQPELLDMGAPLEMVEGHALTTDNTEQVFLVANSDLQSLLPSLPWIKTEIPSANYPHPAYLLDTTQANLSFHRDYVRTTYGLTNMAKLHFSGADVTSMTNISSFIVTMGGASFNQQVHPVNFSPTTASAAQTTTVPIIEVYYPLLQKPTDLTTDLLIIKEAFSNAAPIRINPSLLRERSITFKVWCILKDGRMREVLIPSSAVFAMQICFELSPLQ